MRGTPRQFKIGEPLSTTRKQNKIANVSPTCDDAGHKKRTYTLPGKENESYRMLSEVGKHAVKSVLKYCGSVDNERRGGNAEEA